MYPHSNDNRCLRGRKIGEAGKPLWSCYRRSAPGYSRHRASPSPSHTAQSRPDFSATEMTVGKMAAANMSV